MSHETYKLVLRFEMPPGTPGPYQVTVCEVLLRVPDRDYTFTRSVYGDRCLVITVSHDMIYMILCATVAIQSDTNVYRDTGGCDTMIRFVIHVSR